MNVEEHGIRAFTSERHVFTVLDPAPPRKLFQIQFQRSDGSIFVHFPYFRDCLGIVAVAAHPGGLATRSVRLAQTGKITSQKVKFVHHPDGRAQFSQDKRVFTQILRRSVPLHAKSSHLFTIHINGLYDFKSTKENEKHSSDKHRCVVPLNCPSANSLKFVAYWYTLSELESRALNNTAGPFTNTLRSDGKLKPGVLLRAPQDIPLSDHALLVTFESSNPLTKESSVLFIGGFDDTSIVQDRSKEASFLAMLYPAWKGEELKSIIGSIDYQ